MRTVKYSHKQDHWTISRTYFVAILFVGILSDRLALCSVVNSTTVSCSIYILHARESPVLTVTDKQFGKLAFSHYSLLCVSRNRCQQISVL